MEQKNQEKRKGTGEKKRCHKSAGGRERGRTGRTQDTQNRVGAQGLGLAATPAVSAASSPSASLPAQHLRGLAYPPPKNNLNTKNN